MEHNNEQIFKDIFFNEIRKASSKQAKANSLLERAAYNIGKPDIKIPNINITLNNKIQNLSRIFKNAGLSMFSSESEGNESFSFIGDAILHDLIGKAHESVDKLEQFSDALSCIYDKKNMEDFFSIKGLFLKMKSFFSSEKTNEDKSIFIDKYLQEYKDIDEEIYRYNLEENLVSSLVKEFTEPEEIMGSYITHRYNASVVPEVVKECVVPDLEKLGLTYLVPQLEKDLIEEYKKDLPDDMENYGIQRKDMHLFVPDFSEKEEKNKNVGTMLDDLELIDKTVSASDRKATTNIIKKEIQPQTKEKDKDKSIIK